MNLPLPWPEGGSKPSGRKRISYRAFRDAVAPHGLIPCPALKQWWYRGHQPEEAVAAFRQINTSTADEFIVSTTAGVGQIRTMRTTAGVIRGRAH